MCISRPTWWLRFLLLLSCCCAAQEAKLNDIPKSLILTPSAFDIERANEGCESLEYTAAERYPGTQALAIISKQLRLQGWTPAHTIDRRWMRRPGVFKTAGRWEHFRSAGGSTTYVRAEQWSDKAGDLVSYNFWYFSPDLAKLRVEARSCAAQQIEKYRCVPEPPAPHNEKAHSLALKITKVAPMQKDFKVSVKIENNGTKPVLVGLNGKLSDGSPELWVLGLEQEEQGQWASVDAVCPEHDPFDWIILKPGEDVESWALAVDFPEPNHRWAVCSRKVAHLHGKVRASIRYYTSVCDIENSSDSKDRYFATSEAVELPPLQP